MLPQQQMIDKLRTVCHQDKHITGAVLAGSFGMGEGDAYSDLDCVLFFRDDALPTLDRRLWLEQIAPVLLFFPDDFGHFTAIFDGLIRAEFHFDSENDIQRVAMWKGFAWLPSLEQAILVDRIGELTRALQPLTEQVERDTPQTVQHISHNFINLALFGLNVLERGERARALELLNGVHRSLLWMARLMEGATVHWPTPSRSAEKDLSQEAYERLVECTSALEAEGLRRAYQTAWAWGVEMMRALHERHSLPLPEQVITQITQRVVGLTARD